MGTATTGGRGISAGTALRFVILIGIVSLFADMTYKGACIGEWGAAGASMYTQGWNNWRLSLGRLLYPRLAPIPIFYSISKQG